MSVHGTVWANWVLVNFVADAVVSSTHVPVASFFWIGSVKKVVTACDVFRRHTWCILSEAASMPLSIH